MKKILLIAFAFLNGFYLFSNKYFYLDLFTSTNIKNNFQNTNFSYDDFTSQLFDNLILGGKLQNQIFQANFYTKDKNITSGILFSTNDLFKPISLEIKVGNLSFSGSFSKLNNPLLSSSISPFTNAQTTSNGLQASIPGYSSFSKPISYFLQMNINSKKNNNFKKGFINFAYIQNGNQNYFMFSNDDSISSSAKLDFITKQKNTFSLATTGTIFTYDENIPSSWFSKSQLESYYPQRKSVAQNIQASAEIKSFSTIISSFFYQTPFGNIDYLLKNENKYTINNWILNFSQFYSPMQTITSSEKIIEKMYQLKSTIQYSFCLPVNENLFFVKTGIGFYFATEDDENIFKATFGLQNQYKNFSGKIISILSFTEKDTIFTKTILLNSGTIQVNLYLPSEKIKTSIVGNISFCPKNIQNEDNTTSEKIGINMIFSKINNLKFSNTIKFSQKNGLNIKKEFSSSITEKITWKNINYNIKISADFTF